MPHKAVTGCIEVSLGKVQFKIPLFPLLVFSAAQSAHNAPR